MYIKGFILDVPMFFGIHGFLSKLDMYHTQFRETIIINFNYYEYSENFTNWDTTINYALDLPLFNTMCLYLHLPFDSTKQYFLKCNLICHTLQSKLLEDFFPKCEVLLWSPDTKVLTLLTMSSELVSLVT